MIVIWALYDDALSSYKTAVERYFSDKHIQVHSVGINDIMFDLSDKYFYHKIDLSIINFNLIAELKKLPQPDIIIASPPCESWSNADAGGVMARAFNNNIWQIMNKNFYDEYNKVAVPQKRRDFYQKEQSRVLGEATIGATIKIIKEFIPKVWVIENPQTSKSWEFQRQHYNFYGYENLAHYSSYDENFSLKPTIFKSNIELQLLSGGGCRQ